MGCEGPGASGDRGDTRLDCQPPTSCSLMGVCRVGVIGPRAPMRKWRPGQCRHHHSIRDSGGGRAAALEHRPQTQIITDPSAPAECCHL